MTLLALRGNFKQRDLPRLSLYCLVWAVCTLALASANAPAAEQPAQSRDEPLDNIEATQLPLNLLGVFVHTDPARSGAIIATEDGRQRYLSVNDAVAPQVSLLRVETNSVILAGTSGLERLFLERARRSQLNYSAAPAEPQPISTANTDRAPRQSARDEVVRAELNRRMEIFRQARGAAF